MARRNPLTVREHIALGRKLYEARIALTDALLTTCDAYGVTSPITRAAEKALAIQDKLQSLLDDQVCGEHPLSVREVEGVPLTHIYYCGVNYPTRGYRTGATARAALVAGEAAKAA